MIYHEVSWYYGRYLCYSKAFQRRTGKKALCQVDAFFRLVPYGSFQTGIHMAADILPADSMPERSKAYLNCGLCAKDGSQKTVDDGQHISQNTAADRKRFLNQTEFLQGQRDLIFGFSSIHLFIWKWRKIITDEIQRRYIVWQSWK